MNHHGNNTNSLLVEIMIAVLFFSLCTVMLLQNFISIHNSTGLSGDRTYAMVEARDLLEQMNAADDAAAVLLQAGAVRQEDGGYLLEAERWQLRVTLTQEQTASGVLTASELQAVSRQSGELFTLHGAHYRAGEVE